MSWEQWFTTAVIVVTIAVLIRDLLPPSVAMTGAMVATLTAGIITPTEALAGFSNPAPVTIAALYVLAKAADKTGALTPAVGSLLGNNHSQRMTTARLTVPATFTSAFLNNTPIVAMLIPQVEIWAEARNRSPSHYLLPLSYAAVLGGVVTLMGTATNIVVSGLLEAAGQPPLGFFEITKIGLPVAVVGVSMIIALAPVLMPTRRSASQASREEMPEFTVDMVVETGGPLDGASVDQAGLRNLAGVFLVEIDRGGETIAAVGPDHILHGADRLRFAGRVDNVVDLLTLTGVALAEQTHVDLVDTPQAAHFQAVIGAGSFLSGRTLKEIGFRSRYQAAVVAIHRAGQRVEAKLGDIELRAGDTLLVIADPGWKDRWSDRQDFILIAPLAGTPRMRSRRALVVAAVAVGIVATAATGVLPMVTAALLGGAALVVFGVVSPREAKASVDLDVIVTIGSAFGLAAAMEASGLAATIADGLVKGLGTLGPAGLLAGVVLTTVLLKELITNKAAVLLVFPIAIATADSIGINPRGFALAVAVAAATSFLTPIGYQTNMMVYGPGGYRFTDYLRLGIPLTVAVVAVILVGVPIIWPF
ncbi:MAG TPA: SLC13 family permease [Acidimicrobiia bacterium]|nr:SLC13 family permease [Acidimicrobiia bacterium]